MSGRCAVQLLFSTDRMMTVWQSVQAYTVPSAATASGTRCHTLLVLLHWYMLWKSRRRTSTGTNGTRSSSPLRLSSATSGVASRRESTWAGTSSQLPSGMHCKKTGV
jgi:hypothetical protein